ncbi:hypothetical protein [Pseudoruegeria sp. SK021]|uniref:hypothetical protein n=1 Tax=Pseudoruegeria sp. SK021 TaxID=1933035 RepID=UPI00111BE29B|nr:hypothetical protein [Pseudoruegeria sp. SK021]
MLSTTRTEIVVDGHRYVVRHTDARAEAVRVSVAKPADKRVMIATAAKAIERASACQIRAGTLYGDQVMAEAFLDCLGQNGVTLSPRTTWRP